MVFDFSKAVIAYRFSVLLSCPFPGPLVKERRLLLGIPPLTTPIGIPWLLASPAPNPGYIKQKENCHVIFRSQDPFPSLPSSLHISEFAYVLIKPNLLIFFLL